MPLENIVVSEKSQFPGTGEMIHQWQGHPDVRDGFIYWLRGEFAAANAMIDSLYDHLRAIGEPGEYDAVMMSIKERRCNWNHVLHMQQFFPVAEVTNALQQVGWRRLQRKGQGREFRRSGGGFRPVQRERVVENGEKVVENGVVEVKRDMIENLHEGSCIKVPGIPQETISHISEPDVKPRVNCKGHSDAGLENGLNSIQNPSVKQNDKITAKTFVANEMVDGKTVNLFDGMKFYNEMLDISEVAKIFTLVNDMRAAGKRGELQGHTFVCSKRPMKGHGREMIHLGLPIANALPEDQNMLPIPQLLQDLIDRLVCTQVLTMKPDSCIIDVFDEGDYSHPQQWPSWYGRPVSVLFLTECEMTFGKSIVALYPGYYKGSLKLSLQPGSMLVMQGNSVDVAKYAMPSLKKQRILITFTKSQPRKPAPIDVHRLPSPALSPIPRWGPPPNRSPTHVRHPIPNYYRPTITNGVLPAQPVRPHQIFMHPPVAPVIPFPAPVALPPRLPLPGTGVFLPPGSNNSSSPSITVTNTNSSAEAGMENGVANPNEGKLNNTASSHKECNGSLNNAKKDQQQVVEIQANGKS